MSDSIKKYNEMVEDGRINPTQTINVKHHDHLFELVSVAVEIARKHKDLSVNTIYEIATDELDVRKVCD